VVIFGVVVEKFLQVEGVLLLNLLGIVVVNLLGRVV